MAGIARQVAAPRRWIPGVRASRQSEYRVLAAAIPISAAIVTGMALGSSTLAAAGAMAAVLTAVVSPLAGLAILAFMMPLKPPPVIPAPGFDFFLVGAVLLGCFYRLPIDRPQPRANLPLLLLTASVAYVGIQQLPELAAGYRSAEDHEVGYQFMQLVTGLGIIVAAAYALRRRSPYPVLAMALAGATVAALIAVATYDNPPAGPPFAGLVAQPEQALRAIGPFGNPNYMGTFAAIAVTLAGCCFAITSAKAARGLLLISVLLTSSALLLSQSRGALVAAFVGLAALCFTRSRRLGVAVVGFGIIMALVLYPAFVDWRLGNLGVARAAAITGSDEVRLEGVLAGPQLFLSSPIVGIGFGHYSAMSTRVPGIHAPINAHNWYVSLLAEQGLVGVALWAMFAVALVRGIMRRPLVAQHVAIPVLAALATACMFLEAPTSFQTVSLPSLVLVATLCCDWGAQSVDPGLTTRSGGTSGQLSMRTD